MALSRTPILLTLAVLLAGIAAAANGAESPVKKPNILVLLCDDLGYGDLACFGHPVIRTPELDRLAATGIRLTDCYASAPVCSPSRCGMLTGRTPTRYAVDDWIPLNSSMHLPRREHSFATILKAAGYATCHIGKWHCNGKFNSPDQPQPGDHGFDYWFSTQNNAEPSHENPVNFVRGGNPVGALKGFSNTILVDEAIGWLDTRLQEQPFCLAVWFHSPHEPIATPQEYVSPYASRAKPEQALYFGNVSHMDHEVGRLLSKLATERLTENTFVFFTSDNGPETLNRYQGAARSYGSAGNLRGMKLSLYEGGIRVPGIVRWPGHTTPGSTSSEPVINTDLLPTLCELAGVPTPTDRDLDGVSWLPLLNGKQLNRKEPLYWHYPNALGDFKIAVRQGDWKLLATKDRSRYELYNVAADPKESRELSMEAVAKQEALRVAMDKYHTRVSSDRERVLSNSGK